MMSHLTNPKTKKTKKRERSRIGVTSRMVHSMDRPHIRTTEFTYSGVVIVDRVNWGRPLALAVSDSNWWRKASTVEDKIQSQLDAIDYFWPPVGERPPAFSVQSAYTVFQMACLNDAPMEVLHHLLCRKHVAPNIPDTKKWWAPNNENTRYIAAWFGNPDQRGIILKLSDIRRQWEERIQTIHDAISWKSPSGRIEDITLIIEAYLCQHCPFG